MVATFTLHHGADRLQEDVPGDSGDSPLLFQCISLSVGYSTYMVLLYLCQRLWRYFINDLFGILPGTVLLGLLARYVRRQLEQRDGSFSLF